MSPDKTIGESKDRLQAQALRKLRSLLQRWRQKHDRSGEPENHLRDTLGEPPGDSHGEPLKAPLQKSFLCAALLMGAAHYLSTGTVKGTWCGAAEAAEAAAATDTPNTALAAETAATRGTAEARETTATRGTAEARETTATRGTTIRQESADRSFESALSVLIGLWPEALPQATGRLSVLDGQNLDQIRRLISNQALAQDFLEICKHPQVQEIFASPLCPSAIYEAFSFNERQLSKDLLQQDRTLLKSRHLISFTQVYTPEWVVDHLLKSTLGAALQGSCQLARLKEISLLDPALGGGIFLVQAMEQLISAYLGQGMTAAEALKSTIANNLFGLDIDVMALATAALSILLKAFSLGLDIREISPVLPLSNLTLIEEEEKEENSLFPLGSLSIDLRQVPGHPLSRRYDVIVANPPYLGRKLLPIPLKEKLKRHYKVAANDLSQAFLSMALDLAKPGGLIGFITQGSLLHLASAKCLREKILTENQLLQVVELGAGVFPLLAGEKASTALLVIRNSPPAADQEGHFLSLVEEEEKSTLLPDPARNLLDKMKQIGAIRKQSDFLQDEDGAINYLRPPVVSALKARLPKLGEIATLRQGLATTDNARFLRYIWEVDPSEVGGRFVPYARGEGSERWWNPFIHLVLWENNGRAIKEAVDKAYPYLKGKYAWVVKNEDYYFREGLTFSFVSKHRLAVRTLPPGAIFDVGSSAIFPTTTNKASEKALLAYLNSSLATAMAHDLNPTINFQVGDLKKLVVPAFSRATEKRLAELANQCLTAKQELFQLSSAQRFYFKTKACGNGSQTKIQIKSESFGLDAKEIEISEAAFSRDASAFEQAHLLLGAGQAEIDELVMKAVTADALLSEEDREAICLFAHGKTPNSKGNLSQERFCRRALLEAVLHFFRADRDRNYQNADRHPSLLVAGLEDEEGAETFLRCLPARIDISFLRAGLGQGKGLARYLLGELGPAVDEEFCGQPPILVIKLDAQTLALMPTPRSSRGSLSDRSGKAMINQCGRPHPASVQKAGALLSQGMKLGNQPGIRARELSRALARASLAETTG